MPERLAAVPADVLARLSEPRHLVGVLEHTAEGVWIVDADGTTMYANPALARLLGTTPDQVLGRRSVEFVLDGERERAEREFERRRGGGGGAGRWRLRAADGSVRHVQAWSIPIVDDGGAVVAIVAMVHDISEEVEEAAKLDRARALLRVADEAERRRIADGLHDEALQTLVAVALRAQLAERRYPDAVATTVRIPAGRVVAVSGYGTSPAPTGGPTGRKRRYVRR